MPVSEPGDSGPVLELDGLAVEFAGGGRTVRAVDDVSFAVGHSETRGVVGESGSGKSVSLMASFGLLPRAGRVVAGAARFRGRDLLSMRPDERRRMLGRDVGFVFQNPLASLDPVISIGGQLCEALQLHDRKLPTRAALARSEELLGSGRDQPSRAAAWPSTRTSSPAAWRSGDDRHRAREPSRAPRRRRADDGGRSTIQADPRSPAGLKARNRGASILISHDLGVIAENTDSLTVLYAGRVMKSGATRASSPIPGTPTRGPALLPAVAPLRRAPWPRSPASPDAGARSRAGCPFQPRAPSARPRHLPRRDAPLAPAGAGVAACHFAGSEAFRPPGTSATAAPPRPRRRSCRLRGSRSSTRSAGTPLWARKRVFRAVDGVDLDVLSGEALGIVGESGSGKSTLARVMMRLVDATRGEVRVRGPRHRRLDRGLGDFRDRSRWSSRPARLPRSRGAASATMPPSRCACAAGRRGGGGLASVELFREVGLEPDHYDPAVNALSGGSSSGSVSPAALVLDPEVIVMDEPVSALDVSIQARSSICSRT